YGSSGYRTPGLVSKIRRRCEAAEPGRSRAVGNASAIEVADARAALEILRKNTAAADPYHPAPPHWIAAMHDALKAVSSWEHAQRCRCDGLHGIHMAYLHRRVGLVLEEFDRLIADRPPEQPMSHR